jgi:Mce-associated membrane protein
VSRVPTAEAGREDGIMSGVTSAPADDDAAGEPRRERRTARLSIPLVPALCALLVLLLAGVAFLWFTRPGSSSIRTDDYAEALQAARSNIVDLASYDYLTFEDDLEQIRRVTTKDLGDETVAGLEAQREVITDGKVVVNTEVRDAGITRATEDSATALLFIEATQTAEGSDQTQVRRYPLEVDLQKQDDGQWLLSGLRGRGLG